MIYLGVDETTLYLDHKKVVVLAQTSNPDLVESQGHGALPKAKDFLREGKKFPTLEEMEEQG